MFGKRKEQDNIQSQVPSKKKQLRKDRADYYYFDTTTNKLLTDDPVTREDLEKKKPTTINGNRTWTVNGRIIRTQNSADAAAYRKRDKENKMALNFFETLPKPSYLQTFNSNTYYTDKPDKEGKHTEVSKDAEGAISGKTLLQRYRRRYERKQWNEIQKQKSQAQETKQTEPMLSSSISTELDNKVIVPHNNILLPQTSEKEMSLKHDLLKTQEKQHHFQKFDPYTYYDSIPNDQGIHAVASRESRTKVVTGHALYVRYRQRYKKAKELEDKKKCDLERETIKRYLNTTTKNDEFKKVDFAVAGSLAQYDFYPLKDLLSAYVKESSLLSLLKLEENINKNITRYHQLNAELGIQETEFTPVTATYTRDLLQKKREKILSYLQPLYDSYPQQKEFTAFLINQGWEQDEKNKTHLQKCKEEINKLIDSYDSINALLGTQSPPYFAKVDSYTNAVTTTPTLAPMSSSMGTTELDNKPTIPNRNMLFTPQPSEQAILDSFISEESTLGNKPKNDSL